MRGALLGGVVMLSMLVMSAESKAADITKGQCVDANTAGQNLRKDGKLSAARAQFQTCNDPKCPEIVRADCTQRLDEIETAFPSIVFDVKKADGSDLVDVKVSMDGKVVAEKTDGTPLAADPGSHEFSFEVPGAQALTRTFVLKEGEKLRRERIQVSGPEGVTPPKPPEPAKAPEPASSNNGDIMRVGGMGLAAVGVVGVGLGVFFGLKASSKWSDQQDNCKSDTDCPHRAQAVSDHDGAVKYGGFSTVSFIIGGVFLAAGATLYLLAPKSDAPKTGWRDPLRFSF